jgi:hypothetical protein
MEKDIVSNSKVLLNQLNSSLQSAINNSELNLKQLLVNPYARVSLRVFLGLYAAFAAPNLPKNIALLMDSTVIRIIFATLIVYVGFKEDPLTALMLAIVFIITLQTADKYKLYDTSLSITSQDGISWLPSAKDGAVLGKELYDNPADLLKTRVLQTEMARDKFVEKEMDKNSNVVDAELVRQNTHHILEEKIAKIPVQTQNVPHVVLPTPVIVKNNLSNITRELGNQVIQLGSNISSGVVNSAGHLGQATYNASNNLVAGTVHGVSTAGAGALNAVASLGTGVVGGAYHLGSGVKTGANQLSTGVLSGVHALGSGVVGGVQDIKTGVVGGVSTLGDCIINSASQIGSGLLSGVKHISDGLVEGAARVGNGALGGVNNVGNGVIGGVYNVGSGLSVGTQQLTNGLMMGANQLGTGVTTGLRTGGSELRSGVVSLAQPIYLSEHMTNIPDPINNCSYLPFTDNNQLNSAGDNTIPMPSSYVNNKISAKPIMNAEHMTNPVNNCTENSYTSNLQLDKARNNSVEGAELDSVVSSFKNQYNAQGMYSNYVNGYGGGDYSSY